MSNSNPAVESLLPFLTDLIDTIRTKGYKGHKIASTDCDDILQDTIMRMILKNYVIPPNTPRGADGIVYSEERHFKACAFNLVRNSIQRFNTQAGNSIETATDPHCADWNDHEASEDYVDPTGFLAQMIKAYCLTDDEKTVLDGRINGDDFDTIAEDMGKSKAAVYKVFDRAKGKLRNLDRNDYVDA